MRARIRVVSYSDESLKGTRRPRLPVLVPCVVYPQLSYSCQPPFGLSEALLARCCCLRRCKTADIVFARHSQFHFSAIAIAEHVCACMRRWHNSCVPRHRTYPDTTRYQAQLVPRRDLRRNNMYMRTKVAVELTRRGLAHACPNYSLIEEVYIAIRTMSMHTVVRWVDMPMQVYSSFTLPSLLPRGLKWHFAVVTCCVWQLYTCLCALQHTFMPIALSVSFP